MNTGRRKSVSGLAAVLLIWAPVMVWAQNQTASDSLCDGYVKAYQMNDLTSHPESQRCGRLQQLYANGAHACYLTEMNDACSVKTVSKKSSASTSANHPLQALSGNATTPSSAHAHSSATPSHSQAGSSLAGGSDEPLSRSAAGRAGGAQSRSTALTNDQDSEQDQEARREQESQRQQEELAVSRQQAALEQQQQLLAQQQSALAQQESQMSQASDDDETDNDDNQDDADAAPRSNPNGNLIGSFAQAYVQMKTGDSALAAQAATAAGADEDVVEQNTAQIEQNRETQQRAQEMIEERKSQLASQQAQLRQQQLDLQQRRQALEDSQAAMAAKQPTKVWPVPTAQWCAANPGSGNPNCGSSTLASTSGNSGPKLMPNLNRSSCVHIIKTTAGRYIQNDCSVPVNVAYCAVGPVDDGQICSPSNGPFGTQYAQSTINTIRPGGYASNSSAVSPQNKIAFFACQASGSSGADTQAILDGFDPPTGNCVVY